MMDIKKVAEKILGENGSSHLTVTIKVVFDPASEVPDADTIKEEIGHAIEQGLLSPGTGVMIDDWSVRVD